MWYVTQMNNERYFTFNSLKNKVIASMVFNG